MKLAIAYDSKSDNTAKMGEHIIEGIQSVEGVEAEAFHIDFVNEKYVCSSEALIIGTLTYNGYPTASLKAWLEKDLVKLNIAGKVGGAYATAAYIHSGGELAIQCILTHLMVDGMMVYSGGGAKGEPVIHLGPVAIASDLDSFAELFRIYGKRMAEQVLSLHK